MPQSSIKNVVQIGLGTLLILMFILGVAGMYQLRAANQSLSNIVEDNNAKIALANTMRDAIRLRQIGLHAMLAETDPFGRDELLMQFYEHAGQYRFAREKLVSLPMNEQEKSIHTQLTEVSRVSQPLYKEAAELITNDGESQEIKTIVKQALMAQGRLLLLLNKLVELQNDYANKFVVERSQKYDQSLVVVFGAGALLILCALIVVRLVSRFVTNRNEELQNKNRELENMSVEALAATRTKSAFLATMSHEIRTPLTAIIGFAEATLDHDQSASERVNATNTIIRSGKHLLNIINDLLDLSKIEANKLELDRQKFSPVELLSDIELLIKPQANHKGLTFDIDYEFPLPVEIYNDPLRLKQLLLNLSDNAIKFTNNGRITIRIACDKDKELLHLAVIDSGIGMSDEQAEKVFDAFTQADASIARKYGGTGLGLAVSKSLAQAMGGTITLKTLLNTGSQFSISINTGSLANTRFYDNKTQLPSTVVAQVEILPATQVSGKILLVEDNVDNQKLISYFLKKMGADVDMAENGRIAVDKAQQQHFDLILMDMQMPVMGGMEAVAILRQNNYTKPIVALTANAMKNDEIECLQGGCDEFLSKPVNRKQLFMVVSKYLSKREVSLEPIESTLLANEPEFADLVYKFVDRLPLEISRIENAFNAQDWKLLKELVHSLKGIGGAMGFQILTEISGKIQTLIIGQDYSLIDRPVQNLIETSKRIAYISENERSEPSQSSVAATRK